MAIQASSLKNKADLNSLEFPAEWKRELQLETGLGRRLFEPKELRVHEDWAVSPLSRTNKLACFSEAL